MATDWVVERVSRDDSHDEEELPPAPHPRCSPELVRRGLVMWGSWRGVRLVRGRAGDDCK